MGGAPELWRVEIFDSASRQLRQLPEPEREEALDIAGDLREDPFLPGLQRLRGYSHRYKIRFGRGERYRMFLDILTESRKVYIRAIKLRTRATYSGMDKW